jgi:hypothetical protein
MEARMHKPKTMRRTLTELEELRELRNLLEQFKREWLERTPPADQFSTLTHNDRKIDDHDDENK